MKRKTDALVLITAVSITYNSQVNAENECKVQYRHVFKNLETKTVMLNAGETKDLSLVTSVKWVKNRKEWPVSIFITNKGVGAKNKWVDLPHVNNIDPPYGVYPNGVTLYKIRCEESGPGSTQLLQGQVTTIPASVAIRPLTSAEKQIAKSVYGNTINYSQVKVTNTVGFQSKPWTTNRKSAAEHRSRHDHRAPRMKHAG
jgi:hypothetical protein